MNTVNCVESMENQLSSSGIFPQDTILQILKEIHVRMTVRQTSPEEFEDRIIVMSMFNDIDWTKEVDSIDSTKP